MSRAIATEEPKQVMSSELKEIYTLLDDLDVFIESYRKVKQENPTMNENQLRDYIANEFPRLEFPRLKLHNDSTNSCGMENNISNMIRIRTILQELLESDNYVTKHTLNLALEGTVCMDARMSAIDDVLYSREDDFINWDEPIITIAIHLLKEKINQQCSRIDKMTPVEAASVFQTHLSKDYLINSVMMDRRIVSLQKSSRYGEKLSDIFNVLWGIANEEEVWYDLVDDSVQTHFKCPNGRGSLTDYTDRVQKWFQKQIPCGYPDFPTDAGDFIHSLKLSRINVFEKPMFVQIQKNDGTVHYEKLFRVNEFFINYHRVKDINKIITKCSTV